MDERLTEAVDELDELASRSDLSKIKSLMKQFDSAIAAMTTDDREAKNQARVTAIGISKEAFGLEKKYVPRIPGNESISQELACESMIMTVGLQKEPIILSILSMKPQKVILLHTDGSRPTALEVENSTEDREYPRD